LSDLPAEPLRLAVSGKREALVEKRVDIGRVLAVEAGGAHLLPDQHQS
jgi:hypothetical protein